jgi:hypothetical protein
MSFNRKAKRSRLLVKITEADIDSETSVYIAHGRSARIVNSTFVRGIVTGRSWLVFHEGKRPTRKFIRHAEAFEMEALPTVGAMQ